MARVSYIDTLRLTLLEKIDPKIFDMLMNGRGQPEIHRRKRYVMHHATVGGCVKLVFLHQPCFTDLELLRQLRETWFPRRVFEISRVDVALDLKATDGHAANELRTYLLGRLRPKKLRSAGAWVAHAGQGPATWDLEKHRRGGYSRNFTTYLNYDCERGQTIAMYSDRPSKTLGGEPCTHVEWRFKGSQAVRSAGLCEIDDLTEMDHYAFWDERLRLLRPTADAELQTRDRLRQISHQWMLPGRENALWDDAAYIELPNQGP